MGAPRRRSRATRNSSKLLMTQRPRLLAAALLLAAFVAGACGTPPAVPRPVLAPPPQPVEAPAPPPPQPPPPDPAVALIAASQEHFNEGERELQLGHLESAKAEFDLALGILLQSPAGARATPQLQEHFDRLVDRISAYELRALAQGDGFAEQPEPPASLDDLLAISTFELPEPKPELRTAVELDLKATAHDIPIPLNGRVLAYIELFQGRLRDWFQAALQRGQAHIPKIQDRLRAQGLPQDLAYVPIVESAFHSTALSRAKAKGMWQLMRGTAVDQGLTCDWYVDERANPDLATGAALAYLGLLNRMFDGDWHLTLASYNGGPGTLQRAIKRRKTDDFWRLAAAGRTLPRETREYVPMVLAAIVVARNPAQYGFSVDQAPPAAFETVSLSGPVDLRRIAEWAGVAVDEIQRLNPELRRLTTPLRAEAFPLRVPAGTAVQVSAQLSSAAPEDLVALQYYTVRKGESLSTIAKQLRVKRADLAEANYLTIRSRVRPGERLVIPRAAPALLAVRTDAAASPSAVVVASSAPVSESGSRPPGRSAELTRVTYRVKKGDTLSSIARAFRTTVEEIRSWNRLTSDRIAVGARLTVYTSRVPGNDRP
jgi:membrane-bound lytic murein transglycosylase D